MAYFVIADDGQRYGPADVDALNQWIQEGRLLPATLLEEESSGARIAAGSVPGLKFASSSSAASAPPSATQPPGGYSRPPSDSSQQPPSGPSSNPYAGGQAGPTRGPYSQGQQYPRAPSSNYDPNAGQGELIASWIFGALGLVCCGFVGGIIGLIFGLVAKNKGNPTGKAAVIFNGVVIALGIILAAVVWPKMIQGFQKGMDEQAKIQQGMRSQPAPPFPGTPNTTGQ